MKKKSNDYVECLDYDDIDDNGFIEGDFTGGKTIASFSFSAAVDEQPKTDTAAQMDINKQAASKPLSSLSFRVSQGGITPAVDGEFFSVKRCYQFRPSTLRKLNELKANSHDYNVYLNTIIDQAISFYYDHVFTK